MLLLLGCLSLCWCLLFAFASALAGPALYRFSDVRANLARDIGVLGGALTVEFLSVLLHCRNALIENHVLPKTHVNRGVLAVHKQAVAD